MGLGIRDPPFRAAKDAFAVTEFSADVSIGTAQGFIVDIIKTVGVAADLNQDTSDSETNESKRKQRVACEAFLNWWKIF